MTCGDSPGAIHYPGMQGKFLKSYALVAGIIAVLALVDLGPVYAILKPIPIWMLLARIGRLPLANTKRGRALLTGLALSSIGDIVLSLPVELSLLLGMAAFFFAQCAYAVSFFAVFRYRVSRLPLALLVIAWVALMVFVLKGNTGELTLPIHLYLAAVATMTIAAAFRSPAALTVFFGAAWFALSDSLIAIDRFVSPVPAGGLWIMATYYLAQFLIALGSLEPAEKK